MPQVQQLRGVDGAAVPVRIVMRRIGLPGAARKDRFLLLATSGLGDGDVQSTCRLYCKRWEVETLFAALKSRGSDLEATHTTTAERIERLIGLLAVAFASSHRVGVDRAARDSGPRRKAHGHRARSLFRKVWTAIN